MIRPSASFDADAGSFFHDQRANDRVLPSSKFMREARSNDECYEIVDRIGGSISRSVVTFDCRSSFAALPASEVENRLILSGIRTSRLTYDFVPSARGTSRVRLFRDLMCPAGDASIVFE